MVCGLPKWSGKSLIMIDLSHFDHRRSSTAVAHWLCGTPHLMIAQAPALERLQCIACVAEVLTPRLLSFPWLPGSAPSYSTIVPPKRARASALCSVDNFNCGIPWDLQGSNGIFGTISCPMPSSWPPRSVFVGSFNTVRHDLNMGVNRC